MSSLDKLAGWYDSHSLLWTLEGHRRAVTRMRQHLLQGSGTRTQLQVLVNRSLTCWSSITRYTYIVLCQALSAVCMHLCINLCLL